MSNDIQSTVALMNWEEFADRLAACSRPSKRASSEEKAFREYFGDPEFERLRALAKRALQSRKRTAPETTVIVLPGIMGSSLAAVRNGVKDTLIWINALALAAGRMEWLKLTPDGRREALAGLQIQPRCIDKRVYARLILSLSAHWDVQPFAYDWRKDLDLAADALAATIREKFASRPVHLVAHSMGGLVARNLIRRHKALWDSLAIDGRGGRLIMLGTPNWGSFDMVQVFTGEQELVKLLSLVDLKHDREELTSIISTFAGAYQMLPWGPGFEFLYRREAWGDRAVSEMHLKRACAFHEALADPATISVERMRYIAGTGHKTLYGIETWEPGRFRLAFTLDGDGRVPHRLGLPPGVPAYFCGEAHGDLPRNEKVIRAVHELLDSGHSSLLAANADLVRAAPDSRRLRLESSTQGFPSLLVNAEAGAADRRQIEETLAAAASGAVLQSSRKRAYSSVRRPNRLTIELRLGDISQTKAPAIAVGHYAGVRPVNAIGAIDSLLGGWIERAAREGIIGGELGRLHFIPTRKGQLQANAVIVAGLGQEGRLGTAELRLVMYNLAAAASALKLNSFATVLIGAGEGNLSEAEALRALIEGAGQALARSQEAPSLRRIVVVEINVQRHMRLAKLLRTFSGEDWPSSLKLAVKVSRDQAAPKKVGNRAAGERIKVARFGVRLTVEKEGGVYRYTALTRRALAPMREVEVEPAYVEAIAERLTKNLGAGGDEERYGRLLAAYLLPEELHSMLGVGPVTLVVDRSTAALPWEMALPERPGGALFLGLEPGLTRQFRADLGPAPALASPLRTGLRVLVIADPAPGQLHLEGALEEGRSVVRLLERLRRALNLDLEVVSRLGPHECDPVEILALLVEQDFDVIHFAGHGIADEQQPQKGGWVFGTTGNGLMVISSREIFQARRAPRLVFANACFSSAIPAREAGLAAGRRLAGMAEAFFACGVGNYIGAAWPVDDAAAVEFAREFYARAIAGCSAEQVDKWPLGEKTGTAEPAPLYQALAHARRKLHRQGLGWGGYQHYGDATALLVRRQ